MPTRRASTRITRSAAQGDERLVLLDDVHAPRRDGPFLFTYFLMKLAPKPKPVTLRRAHVEAPRSTWRACEIGLSSQQDNLLSSFDVHGVATPPLRHLRATHCSLPDGHIINATPTGDIHART